MQGSRDGSGRRSIGTAGSSCITPKQTEPARSTDPDPALPNGDSFGSGYKVVNKVLTGMEPASVLISMAFFGILACHQSSASSGVQEPRLVQLSRVRSSVAASAGRSRGALARHIRM